MRVKSIPSPTNLGVLLPEFRMRVLEVLRQPMEDKFVTISCAQGSLTLPAIFRLVAAKNPCPCEF